MRHAARRPATLLICYVALLAAAALWLALDPPIEPGPLQRAAADITLGPGAIPTAPAPKPKSKPRPPAPKKTAPAVAPKPKAPEPPQVATSSGTPKPLELNLPPVKPGPKLATAPDPGLVRRGRHGPLPVISAGGRVAWRVYAHPFKRADKRPRIAIVVLGLGINRAMTKTAITGLPGAVTLAFSPYAKRLGQWVREARSAGHEVLLDVPMEPKKFFQVDAGPRALMIELEPDENIRRLEWVLSRTTGYVGLINTLGTRFAGASRLLGPVLKALKSRGLLYLDTVPESVVAQVARTVAIPWAVGEIRIDETISREAIDRKLDALEKQARRAGRVVGLANPYAVTIGSIAWWITGLKAKGIALAPVSAVMFRKRPK
jgi:polysaccharide deacetylase 2 family uncharacterized protein YibQ